MNIKRRIDGVTYDTKRAEQLAEYWTTELSRFDLNYLREGLYRQHGRLFLAGESGARMKYAKNAEGGGKVGGEGITLTTREAAKEWIELTQGKDASNAILLLDGFAII